MSLIGIYISDSVYSRSGKLFTTLTPHKTRERVTFRPIDHGFYNSTGYVKLLFIAEAVLAMFVDDSFQIIDVALARSRFNSYRVCYRVLLPSLQ